MTSPCSPVWSVRALNMQNQCQGSGLTSWGYTTRIQLEHGGRFAGPCGGLEACFVSTALVEAAVLWDVGENKEWL